MKTSVHDDPYRGADVVTRNRYFLANNTQLNDVMSDNWLPARHLSSFEYNLFSFADNDPMTIYNVME